MGTYAYDQAWHDERERLAGIERLWDEGTFSLLERLGVGGGSAVADVGAGGGSVVEWLTKRVGPNGRVLAADVYLKFLEPLAGGAIDVKQHDILAEALPEGAFDVVHARLLVEHIGEKALPNLIAGLKPGGALLLEDYDFALRGSYPPDALPENVTNAVLDVMTSMGFDAEFGRKLPMLLEDAGLNDVHAEGRVRLIRTGTPDTAFYKLSLLSLRGPIVQRGNVSEADIDDALARLDEPGQVVFSPVMVACWGRRA